MDDLITWLRVQLDEDEQAAAEMRENEKFWADCGEPHDHRIRLRRWEFTPDRLLREVEANRRLIDECEAAVAFSSNPDTPAGGYASALVAAVRLAALPFSDRPGYREEWKP